MKVVKQITFDIAIKENEKESIIDEIIKKLREIKKITYTSELGIEDITEVYKEQGYKY